MEHALQECSPSLPSKASLGAPDVDADLEPTLANPVSFRTSSFRVCDVTEENSNVEDAWAPKTRLYKPTHNTNKVPNKPINRAANRFKGDSVYEMAATSARTSPTSTLASTPKDSFDLCRPLSDSDPTPWTPPPPPPPEALPQSPLVPQSPLAKLKNTLLKSPRLRSPRLSETKLPPGEWYELPAPDQAHQLPTPRCERSVDINPLMTHPLAQGSQAEYPTRNPLFAGAEPLRYAKLLFCLVCFRPPPAPRHVAP
eukprot:889567-Prorocentrum_minimum.AAC.1